MHGLFCWVVLFSVGVENWQQCRQLKTRQNYKIFRLIYNVEKKKKIDFVCYGVIFFFYICRVKKKCLWDGLSYRKIIHIGYV